MGSIILGLDSSLDLFALLRMSMDDVVAKTVVDKVGVLKYIHPNVITISGIFLTYLIYIELFKKNVNLAILFLLLALRWLADLLDGAVARRYNKKSHIGGMLDTLSDFLLMLVVSSFFIHTFRLSKCWYLVVIVLELVFIFGYDALSDHSKAKTYPGGVKNVLPFLVQNTIVPYIIVFLLICYVVQKGGHSK
jgi:phosphatidylglycerophosphate synthase